MGGEKESFPPLLRQPIYALSTKEECLIPGYDQKWALFFYICLDDTKFVSLSVFSLIEAICQKILAKPLHKNTKQLLPTDVLHSKSPLVSTLSTFSRTGVNFLPSTTAINDCHRDASCSLNRAVGCSWSFKGHKEQNEIRTMLINCYRCKSKP